MVDSVCKHITDIDQFWSEMNSFPWIHQYIDASANVTKQEKEIVDLKKEVDTLQSKVKELDNSLASTNTETNSEKDPNEASLEYEKQRHLNALSDLKKRHKAELKELETEDRKLRLHNVSFSDRVQKAADIQILLRMEDRPDFIGPRWSRKAYGIDPSPIIRSTEAQSQLPKSEAVPRTTTSNDDASKASVPDERKLGDEDIKEPTAKEGLAETGSDQQQQQQEEPLGSDVGLFGEEENRLR